MGTCFHTVFLCALLLALGTKSFGNTLNFDVINAKTQKILHFIGQLEAPGGYNSFSYYASAPPPKDLTQLTVDEVLAWQKNIDATSKSEAAGRYQIMQETLRHYIVPTMKLTGHELFDSNLQDLMALELLKRRGWNTKINTKALANNLAKEWASLPVVSGQNKGKSYYHSGRITKNRAQTTPDIFLSVLNTQAPKLNIKTAINLSRLKIEVKRIPFTSKTFSKSIEPINSDNKPITGGHLAPSQVIVYKEDPYAQ